MADINNDHGGRRPERSARTAGRPRDGSKDHAIIAAMLAMLARHGFEGASFEKVATAAGVSRPSIYRRWASKDLLVIDAVRIMLSEDLNGEDEARLGTGVVAIRALMEVVATRLADPDKARVIIVIVAEAATRPALATLLADLERQRRAPLLRAIEEAQSAGEILAVTDGDVIADALLGAIYFRRLFSQSKPDGRTTRQVVDGVLGLAQPG